MVLVTKLNSFERMETRGTSFDELVSNTLIIRIDKQVTTTNRLKSSSVLTKLQVLNVIANFMKRLTV